MRIGMVTGEYPPLQGGVGAYTKILSSELHQQGHDLFVYTSAASRDLDSPIPIHARATRWNLNAVRGIRMWAQENHLDVIDVQFQTAAFGMSPFIHFAAELARPIPVITTFHDLRVPYLFPKAGKLRDWIVMRLAKSSSGVIVTNHEDELRLKQLPKVRLIPIGSNILQPLPPDFNRASLRAQVSADSSDFFIGYFGLINHSKGIETLLDGIAALRHDGIPARLVIIGGGAGSSDPSNIAYMRDIDSRIDQLGLRPFIHTTGFLADSQVGAWLTAADIIALPFRDGASYRRGSLMAAIQYGTAIVTTSPAVPIPAFQHEQNMLLHPVDDIAAFTSACHRLYQSSELRARLQNGARALASHFQWTTIAAETAAFFEDVISAVGANRA